MGRGGNLGEALSLSGILKVVEFVLLFCATILHRHGDNGKYLFFGTSAVQMKAVSVSGSIQLSFLGTTLEQGCQMVSFQTKNPNLGGFWRTLKWKMLL
jgi:hypothetical protein